MITRAHTERKALKAHVQRDALKVHRNDRRACYSDIIKCIKRTGESPFKQFPGATPCGMVKETWQCRCSENQMRGFFPGDPCVYKAE